MDINGNSTLEMVRLTRDLKDFFVDLKGCKQAGLVGSTTSKFGLFLPSFPTL